MTNWGYQSVQAAEKGDLAKLQEAIAADPVSAVTAEDGIHGGTALVRAAMHGYTDCLNAVLAAHTNKEAKRKDINEAMRNAARWGKTDCLRILLIEGADIDERNQNGKTALMHAAAWGSVQCVRLLLAAGAKLTFKDDYDRYTALDRARAKQNKCIEPLLAAEQGVRPTREEVGLPPESPTLAARIKQRREERKYTGRDEGI